MKTRFYFLLLFSGFLGQAIAQNIDLSKVNTRNQKHYISPNSPINIQISNLLLNGTYSMEINKQVIPIPTFTNPLDSMSEKFVEIPIYCDSLIRSTKKLFEAKDEGELASEIRSIKSYIKENNEAAQNATCWVMLKDSVNSLLNKTQQSYGPYTLVRGEELEVKITRGTGENKQEWTYVYSAGSRGEWQISYGFTFITQVWNPEEIFYTAEDASSGYILKKEAQRSNLIYSPSLFFTWMPATRMNKNTSYGVSGGLGYDFSKPTLFLGPTLSYNQNIKFHAGVVAHQQKVLNGQYVEGQTLSQILNETQLHKEAYRMNLYFSVSFRFDQNPFNKK